jgi:microcystin-dependent protein
MLNATTGPATSADPQGNVPARAYSNIYGSAANLAAMAPDSVANAGGSQAHLNMQPFLALNFCIALQGIFPSPN